MGKHGQLARIRDLMLSLLQVYLSLLQTVCMNDTDYFSFSFHWSLGIWHASVEVYVWRMTCMSLIGCVDMELHGFRV